MDAAVYACLGDWAIVPHVSFTSQLHCLALGVALLWLLPSSCWMHVADAWRPRFVIQPNMPPSSPPPNKIVFQRMTSKAHQNPFLTGIYFLVGCCWDSRRGVYLFWLIRFVFLSVVDILSSCRGEWNCDTAIVNVICVAGARQNVSSSLIHSYGTTMQCSETAGASQFPPRLCCAQIPPSRLGLGFPQPDASLYSLCPCWQKRCSHAAADTSQSSRQELGPCDCPDASMPPVFQPPLWRAECVHYLGICLDGETFPDVVGSWGIYCWVSPVCGPRFSAWFKISKRNGDARRIYE